MLDHRSSQLACQKVCVSSMLGEDKFWECMKEEVKVTRLCSMLTSGVWRRIRVELTKVSGLCFSFFFVFFILWRMGKKKK